MNEFLSFICFLQTVFRSFLSGEAKHKYGGKALGNLSEELHLDQLPFYSGRT
jgi:hypothetical protein